MASRTFSSPADEGHMTFSDEELQLVWNNNRTKSDEYPKWKTSMIAGESLYDRHYNVGVEQGWSVDQ